MSSAPSGEDQWALRALADRYGVAVDDRDMDALAALFWPDASIYMYSVERPEQVVDALEGLAAIRGIAQWLNDRFHTTLHFVGNGAYEVAGDRATGQVNCVAHHLRRRDDGISDFVVFLRYEDICARREGQWRFVERRLRARWTERRQLGERTQLGPPELAGH